MKIMINISMLHEQIERTSKKIQTGKNRKQCTTVVGRIRTLAHMYQNTHFSSKHLPHPICQIGDYFCGPKSARLLYRYFIVIYYSGHQNTKKVI